MSAIPERLWALMTEEEKQHVKDITNGWRYEPRIVCPNCNCNLGVRLSIRAGAVRIDGETGKPVVATVESPSPTTAVTQPDPEAQLLAEATESGLLHAYEQAVERHPAGHKPSLVMWLKTCMPKMIPQFAVRKFVDKFPGAYLTFWSSNGIIGVAADGVLRWFIPQSYIVGTSVRSITKGGGFSGRIKAKEEDLEVWVKGRFGYVPLHSKNFVDTLRQRNIGSFSNPVQ